MPETTLTKYKIAFKEGELVCASCTTTVRNALAAIKDVDADSIKINLLAAELEAKCPPDQLRKAVEDLGFTVVDIAVDEPSATAEDEAEPAAPAHPNHLPDISAAALASIPRDSIVATPTQTPFDFDNSDIEQKLLWRSIVAFLLGIPLLVLETIGIIPAPTLLMGQLILAGITLVSIGVMLYSGWDIYKDTWRKLPKGVLNMDTLATLGSTLSLVFSLIFIFAPTAIPMMPGMHMSLCAGILILAIVNLGAYLKVNARKKATADLPKMRELYLRLQPSTAFKLDATTRRAQQIPFAQIKKGDLLLVKAGEYFPVDAKIITADAKILVDERTLTGEQTARPCFSENQIQSGMLFKAESQTREVLVEASCDGTKGSFQRTMTQVADAMKYDTDTTSVSIFIRWFVPIVITIAIAASLTWFFLAPIPSMSISVLLSVLLCACPCALGLAAPIAYSTAVNAAFKYKIAVRKPESLDTLAQVKAFAFDMTGTLTEGEMQLATQSPGITAEVLQLVASLEVASQSTHPLAGAIIKANKAELLAETEFNKDSEKRGISGIAKGKNLLIGNSAWLRHHNLNIATAMSNAVSEYAAAHPNCNEVFSTCYIAMDGAVVGYIIAAQKLRAGAADTIRTLNERGIETILLTGAQTEVAAIVARDLKIKTLKAEQTPQQKRDYLEALKYPVAFLGDDPNDFAALTAKNVVGLSIHPQAPAAAAAAINLSGNVSDLLKAMDIAKATRRNINLSLAFMLFYNIVSIALAAGVLFILSGSMLNPVAAAAMMGFSSLIVVLNGRSLRYFIEKKLNPELSILSSIRDYWQNTSLINKSIQIGLSLFSLLLVSTVIANVTLGFSWNVIFDSMILACTCCTGVIGILSAVGLMGAGLFLLVLAARAAYEHFNSDDQPKNPDNKLTAGPTSPDAISIGQAKTSSQELKFLPTAPNPSPSCLGMLSTTGVPTASIAR